MAIFVLLLFVGGLLCLGRFNYRHTRRTARHLMSLFDPEYEKPGFKK